MPLIPGKARARAEARYDLYPKSGKISVGDFASTEIESKNVQVASARIGVVFPVGGTTATSAVKKDCDCPK